jgi:hypothetical protein
VAGLVMVVNCWPMDYYDYRPHALFGILLLVGIVIGDFLAISRRKITFLHVFQVVGWAMTVMLLGFGVIGSAGPPNTNWFGLALFSGLLFLWVRYGLQNLKAMKPPNKEAEMEVLKDK